MLVENSSAENGLTDVLLRTARDFASEPHPETVDLLWSTGELRSVALLALALQNLGVRVRTANVHQTGLGDDTRPSGAWLRLRARLATADVVVVPGFLARGAGDRIVSLGRGSSDLTAVLLAAALDARTCELLKDVPGYFTSDPARDPEAQHIDRLQYDEAIAMAETGCELVQLQALVAARRFNIPLVVRAMDDKRETRLCAARSLRESIDRTQATLTITAYRMPCYASE